MRRAAGLAALFLALSAAPAPAQGGAELGAQATVLLRDEPFYGAGVSAAWRTAGRIRLALAGLYGQSDQAGRFRGELAGHFLVSPRKVGGVGLYAIGGAAMELGEGDEGYLVLGLGLETDPAGDNGFHFEAGIGGGARLSAGWRTRWLE